MDVGGDVDIEGCAPGREIERICYQEDHSEPRMLPDIGRRDVMKAIGVAGIASAASTTTAARTNGDEYRAGLVDRRGPVRKSRFAVELELDGTEIPGWQTVELPTITVNEAMYREGNERQSDNRKLWGRTVYGDLTMTRGVQPDDTRLWNWRKQVMDGKLDEARRDIAINVFGTSGEEVSARFEVEKAWPKEYEPPSLDATAGGPVAEESITLAFDRFVRQA